MGGAVEMVRCVGEKVGVNWGEEKMPWLGRCRDWEERR